MNTIIRNESTINLFGIPARAFNVVADDQTGRIMNQKIGASREYVEDGRKYRIRAELRFDDECKNGHESFSITGSVHEYGIKGYRREPFMCGCIHEEIAKHFPELVHLIKWHLTSTDGPMHYVANTVYSAGNRDCNGREAGAPNAWSYGVQFNSVPVTHRIERKFYTFLQNAGPEPLHLAEIPHRDAGKPGVYQYGPHYTFNGFCGEWHECPFSDRTAAEEFLAAWNNCTHELVKVPTAWSTGKDRELDNARQSAVWPEATDDELSVSKEELTAALLARLPALLAEFKEAMLACGFLWPVAEEV